MIECFDCRTGSRRDKELAAKGWVRRATTDQPRLSELSREYQALGFEVLLEDFNSGIMGEDCASCLGNRQVAEGFKTIYTRPTGQAGE